jgi:uncharacterized protein YggT (Ycf19 family)
MNKNYIPAYVSCPVSPLRACHWLHFPRSVNRRLFRSWRFCLSCVIGAVLLSATAVPAGTITVTNGNDHGPGSLRQAILNASSGDIINFVPSVRTVNLTSDELVIDKNLTITGSFPHRVTVRRTISSFRIFHIPSRNVTVFISRLTISNGDAVEHHALRGNGGGINSAGTLTLTDCIISGNDSPGGDGGGLFNDGGTMSVTRCTISNNFANGDDFAGGGNGGGIANSGGSVIITSSTISGNSGSISSYCNPVSGGGGGVSNFGSMTISNCTISGNSVRANGFCDYGPDPVTMYGGGILNYGNLQITSSTIAHNSASSGNGPSGGGIYSSGDTTTDSSIIALNSAPTGPDFTGGAALESMGYNIIGNNADAVISSKPADQIGTPAAPIDPLLGPLANNGGLTLTHALQAGSPAIDHGDPAAPPQDQRGYGRVGVPDVGAFEYAGVGITLANISTRSFVQTGDNVMIGGFIVHGTEPKRVIIRAIGPELTQYGVPNVLANPTLELHDRTGALIASNDNWWHTIIGGIITSDQRGDIRNSGYVPADGRESAIIAELPAGNYTAIVRGVNNTMGVALVEVYDLSAESNSILGNISTRSFVQTGDNVMIGGFIVQGTAPKSVIVRAIGPELLQFLVPYVLANPTLELHDSNGALIASNDNWRQTIIGGIITSDQVRDIRNSGYAPGDGRESAIIADLPAGNYTAIVRGVNNTTGVALVEVYDLNPTVP